MKYFTTVAESVTVTNVAVDTREISVALCRLMDVNLDLKHHFYSFLLTRESSSGSFLSRELTPSQFAVAIKVKDYLKPMVRDALHRSPRFWYNSSPLSLVNLNVGRALVIIDNRAG